MKKLTILLALLALVAFTVSARQTPQKWEYKIEQREPGEKKLNELGAEGWELVAVPITTHNGTVMEMRYIFKRPK